MLGAVDHVGYLVRDLDLAVEEFAARFGTPIVRPFERPQFALRGVYLGAAGGDIELFSFTEPELLERRLNGPSPALDHVAYRVADLLALAGKLSGEGVRFSGPDLREPLTEPVDLGGTLHLWTVPDTCGGLSIQLLQPPVQTG
jgi:catechol 2,3-dioxygenase-like lactoylglutathione lyase family enzyme